MSALLCLLGLHRWSSPESWIAYANHLGRVEIIVRRCDRCGSHAPTTRGLRR